jgi:hypothetical protein
MQCETNIIDLPDILIVYKLDITNNTNPKEAKRKIFFTNIYSDKF